MFSYIKKDLFKHRSYILFCVISFIIILTGIFAPTVYMTKKYPYLAPLYGYPQFLLGDYLTNIYRIKSGMQGNITYLNAFSDVNTPPAFFLVHYNILGFITSFTHLSAYQVYEVFRVFSIVVFLITVYGVILKLQIREKAKIFAVFFFTFATSFVNISFVDGLIKISDPPLYSDYFNIFTRFASMKPHHLLTFSVFMGLFLFLWKTPKTKLSIFLFIFFTVNINFLHPFMSVYGGVILALFVFSQCLIQKKIMWRKIQYLLLYGIFSFPIFLYHRYVLINYWQAEIDINGVFSHISRTIQTTTYIKGMGIVFLLALVSLIRKKTYIQEDRFFLLLWGLVPFLLFVAPDIGITTSESRVFQMYVLIPLSLLSGIVLSDIDRWKNYLKYLIIPTVLIVTFFYAALSYVYRFKDTTNLGNYYFYSQYVRRAAIPIYEFLEQNSPPNSVVLGGEILSNFMPTYTHNKVIIGHPGTNPHFDQKKEIGVSILRGKYPINQLYETLKLYNIKYIVYGVENLSFSTMPYTSLPFLKEHIVEGMGVSVVEVIYN